MDKKTSSTNKPFLVGTIILVASLCAAGAWIKQTQKQVQAEQDQLTRLQQEEEAQLNSQLNEANAHYLAEANRVNAANADADDDGEVTPDDVVAVVNMILENINH